MTKSEKQKMLSRELYDPNCGELVRERLAAKDLCFRFNQLPPSDIERQRDIIMRLLQAKSRESFLIMAPFWCDYGYNIRIGNNFFANHNTVILDCAQVTFGDNVLIGPNCGFYAAQHPVDAQLRNRGLETAAPIAIGNNVWIGGGAQIMPGVTIGDNAVIGGGSVVVKDIPPDCVAVGNPCKPARAL